MDTIGDAVARRVALRHFERRRGNICGVHFRVREFPRERDGEASGAGADVGHAQFFARRAGVHVNFKSALTEARERDFHDVLGFRARDQHRGRHLKFQSPEFLLAGEILRRLAGSAARDQREKLFGSRQSREFLPRERTSTRDRGQARASTAIRRERVRRSVCRAQARHAFLQSGPNVQLVLICHGVLHANEGCDACREQSRGREYRSGG